MLRKNPSATAPPSERTASKRALAISAVALAAAVPAGILVAGCGIGCDEEDGARGEAVPFCSLPGPVRASMAAGFREGRSPDILAVARRRLAGGTAFESGGYEPPWPSLSDGPDLPLVFWGHGITPGRIPDGARFDSVAPTLARVMQLDRRHPDVRSGRALPGVAAEGTPPPRLVVLAVWKQVGSEGGSRSLAARLETGAGTRAASPGSLPLDPAALMATIGSGSLPRQHGITGALVRNEEGEVVKAWGPDAPTSVIASLGDDLDEANKHEPVVGLVGTSPMDRGLIGGDWYLDSDDDEIAILDPGAPASRQQRAITDLLESDYGRDSMTDLLAFAFEGNATELDTTLEAVEAAATSAANGSVTFALVGLPPTDPDARSGVAAVTAVADEPEMVAAVGVGGVFLDHEVLARSKLTDDALIDALAGSRDFADAFPATAITFARYC